MAFKKAHQRDMKYNSSIYSYISGNPGIIVMSL